MSPESFRGILELSARFWPETWRKSEAFWLLAAIAYQESSLVRRFQVGGGPAVGLWQCERQTIIQLMDHDDVGAALREARRELALNHCDLTLAVAFNDLFAASVARALLWTYKKPLPQVGERAAAWAYYVATWRPGRPRPDVWDMSCSFADKAFGGRDNA